MEKKRYKQIFYSFKHVNFQQGKNSEFLPKCCKMALFALQFSKLSKGACPRTPRPREKSYFFTKFQCKHWVIQNLIFYFENSNNWHCYFNCKWEPLEQRSYQLFTTCFTLLQRSCLKTVPDFLSVPISNFYFFFLFLCFSGEGGGGGFLS